MKSMLSRISKGGPITLGLSVIVSVLFVTGIVNAATTISTNIVTGGTLTVDTTSTLTGAVSAGSTLSVTGLATLLGGATTTSITLLNGETISNGTDGTITFGATNTVLAGTASSSAIRVGGDQNNVISGMISGSCAVADTSFSVASSTYTTCTGATGVSSNYKVFVQATSSIPFGVVIDAASTTVTTGTLSIRLYNTRSTPENVPDPLTAGEVYLNFWAVR